MPDSNGKPSGNRIRDLRGLGPVSEKMLAEIGLTTTEQFLEADIFHLYAQLCKLGHANLNLLFALIGAQEDVPWTEIARSRRTEILLRLEDMGLAPR